MDLIYYRCRTSTDAVLWLEVDDTGARPPRLLDAAGRMVSPETPLQYAVESTDPSLWPIELLPVYRQRRLEQLAANYAAAAQRDYPSAALGAAHTYPADVVSKLYMTARNTQALILLAGVGGWRANVPAAMDEVVRPSADNGWAYRCMTAGTTGNAEPAWPMAADATVIDGTAVWQAWHHWTGDFTCTDAKGVTARRAHTYSQMMQVGLDGVAAVQDLLDRRDALAAQLAAAGSLAAIDAIDLTL